MKLARSGLTRCLLSLIFALPVFTQFIPEEIIVNSGRPTFSDPTFSVPGKIALEEHVGTELFAGTYTTPFVNFTNEVLFDAAAYIKDAAPRLTNIDSRVQAMNSANISIQIVMFGGPGIQGIFNKTFATETAAYVNDQVSSIYAHGNYSSRFRFFCSNALQEPVKAAAELERCVKKLGGVGSFVGGYTNNGTANNVIYLDDPSNIPFLEKVVELDVPIYLHPRMPPPDQQRAYQEYNFLAGSPWGFSSETVVHALRLMVSGLFDKYPTLKIVLGHCGEGLPFYLPRIEQRMRHFTHYWPAKQTVSYYWENNFYVTTSGVQDSGALFDTLRRTGEDRVMFSVDYPFEDEVEIGTWFDRLEISGSTKRKIGYENARRIFKLGS